MQSAQGIEFDGVELSWEIHAVWELHQLDLLERWIQLFFFHVYSTFGSQLADAGPSE